MRKIKILKIYSPVIVLLLWSFLAAIGVGLNEVALAVMALAVFVHIRTEVHHDPSQ